MYPLKVWSPLISVLPSYATNFVASFPTETIYLTIPALRWYDLTCSCWLICVDIESYGNVTEGLTYVIPICWLKHPSSHLLCTRIRVVTRHPIFYFGKFFLHLCVWCVMCDVCEMTAVRCEMCAHRIAVCLKVTCEQSVYRNVPGYKDGFRKFVFPTSDFPRASGLGYYKLLYEQPSFSWVFVWIGRILWNMFTHHMIRRFRQSSSHRNASEKLWITWSKIRKSANAKQCSITYQK